MQPKNHYLRSECGKLVYGYREVWDDNAPAIGFVMMWLPDPTKRSESMTVPNLVNKARQMNGGGVFILFVDPNPRVSQHLVQPTAFDKSIVEQYALEQLKDCYPVVATWRRDTRHTPWYLQLVKDSGHERTLHLFGRYKDGNLHTVPHIRSRTVVTPWRF